MAMNKFNDALGRLKNKMTDSLVNDVKDLRNDEFKSQMNSEKQKSENQQLWDQYKRTGQKIDVPEFDATIQDLPEQDVNEKEIKVEPQGTSYMLPSEEGKNYSLEQLAGNGMPEEEIKEPEIKEPMGTSFELPSEENPQWDLEDYAGNGQREDIVSPQDDTVAEEGSFIEEPEFSEDDVIPEPEEDENSVSDEEVENTPAPEQPPSEEPTNEQPPADKTVADQKLESKKKADEGQEEESVFDNDDEGEIEDEEEEEKPAPITKTEQGPVNDDTDLIKRGSGVSVSDMVDRSQIPHYDYLSFFR